jgi:hypothetical protein
LSFNTDTVGPNIHNAEEEEGKEEEKGKEEQDFEGESECGFLNELHVIGRHRKTVQNWSRNLPSFHSVSELQNTVRVLRLTMPQHTETEVRQLAVPATKLCLSGTVTKS